ncbi:capsule biosynthesis protein CapA, partial [Campylobacter jejuni]|nr:capsule biosynthesis protein CapA [Campylobacter jejuni]
MLYWKDEDLVDINFTTQQLNNTTKIILNSCEELECMYLKINKNSVLNVYYQGENAKEKYKIEDEKIIKNNEEIILFLQENIKTDVFIIEHDYSILNIRLLKRAFKGLIISARYDAFGARMMSLLNTIYLSRLIGFKFGFIWDHKICQNAKDQYMSLDSADKIFDITFCNQHDYTYNNLPHTQPDFNDLIGFNAIEDGDKKPFYENYGYRNLYAYYLHLRFKEIKKDEYFQALKDLYHNLPFSQRYQNIIEKTNLIYKNIGNFIGMHFRGADVVNDLDIRVYALTSLSPYIFPLELAMEIIKKESYKTIVLFSSCNIVTNFVKEYFKKNNFNKIIYIANDFLDNTFSYAERDFFNFSLMQHADILYGSNESMFRALAANISYRNIQNNLVDHVFDLQSQYEIISSNIDNYNIDNLYKSASCIYLFIVASRLNLDNKIKLFWLQKGYKYDQENLSYGILIIENLLLQGHFNEAETELINIFHSKFKFFFQLLFSHFHKDEFFYQRKTFLQYTHINKPALSLMIYLVSLKEGSSSDITYFLYHILQKEMHGKQNILPLNHIEYIHRQLPYRLGKYIVKNSHSLYGYC